MQRISALMWMALLLLGLGAASAAHAEDYSAIQIQDADYSYQQDAAEKTCCGTVVALAQVLNTSERKLEDPVFEARLLDADGKLLDAFHEVSYGLNLMPGQPVAIRVMGRARYGPERYASVQMRLVSGEFEPIRTSVPAAKKTSVWKTLQSVLMAWGPVLLLIGVWLWLVKRSNGLNYQKDVLELMKSQNEMLARQAAAIEKMARMRDASNT